MYPLEPYAYLKLWDKRLALAVQTHGLLFIGTAASLAGSIIREIATSTYNTVYIHSPWMLGASLRQGGSNGASRHECHLCRASICLAANCPLVLIYMLSGRVADFIPTRLFPCSLFKHDSTPHVSAYPTMHLHGSRLQPFLFLGGSPYQSQSRRGITVALGPFDIRQSQYSYLTTSLI